MIILTVSTLFSRTLVKVFYILDTLDFLNLVYILGMDTTLAVRLPCNLEEIF